MAPSLIIMIIKTKDRSPETIIFIPLGMAEVLDPVLLKSGKKKIPRMDGYKDKSDALHRILFSEKETICDQKMKS